MVTCHYNAADAGGGMYEIDVDTVTMWARSANLPHPGPSQRVGWQVIAKYKPVGHKNKTYATWAVVKSHAWSDVSAFYEARQLNDIKYAVGGTYTLQSKLIWYKSGGSVAGTATARYDHYKLVQDGTGTTIFKSNCPSPGPF